MTNRCLSALALLLLAACGGSTSPDSGSNQVATGSMAATIGASSWHALTVIAVRGQDGTIALSGTDASTYNVGFKVKTGATGSFSIPDCSGPGGSDTGTNGASVTDWPAVGTRVWGSDCSHRGTVMITGLSSDGVSGTFNFQLGPASPSTTSTLTVSSGTFSAKF